MNKVSEIAGNQRNTIIIKIQKEFVWFFDLTAILFQLFKLKRVPSIGLEKIENISLRFDHTATTRIIIYFFPIKEPS